MEHTKYDLLLEKAKAGELEAMYEVGTGIMSGDAVFTEDATQSRFIYDPHYGLELVQAAAERHHPEAMAQLGRLYVRGMGVGKDIRKGIELTKAAAESGSLVGQNNYGWWQYIGEFMPKNLEQAFYWTKKASEGKLVAAMETLAMMYWNGEGTQPDFKKAIYWLITGANGGNAGMKEVFKQIKAAKIQNIQGRLYLKNGRCTWSCAEENLGEKALVSGGPGTNYDNAVVVHANNESDGAAIEYQVLAIMFPGYEMHKQSLQGNGNKLYDVIEVGTKEGNKKVYFDVSEFYGKY